MVGGALMYGRAVKCRHCGKSKILLVGLEDYSRFIGGRDVNKVFPYLTEDERSLMMLAQCADACVSWRN